MSAATAVPASFGELDRKLCQLEALLLCPSLESMTSEQQSAFCSLGADLVTECRAMASALADAPTAQVQS